MISLVQVLAVFALVQVGKLATLDVECHVVEHANYTIKGKRTYPHAVYYKCDGCFGQETFGYQHCRLNGSRDGEPLPNCTVSCQNSDTCGNTRYAGCEFYPQTNWERCGKACDTPALCHNESGEKDCQCGWYARKKRCETENNIRLNICPYTCSLRANITCPDPNDLFPNAKATLITTPHWLDTTTFVCHDGYINMGHRSWVACNISGKWILHGVVNVPHCVPKADYRTFRYTTALYNRLEPLKNISVVTDVECARMCTNDIRCTHFSFEEKMCQPYRYPRLTTAGTDLSNKPIWQKVLPTEYTRKFQST